MNSIQTLGKWFYIGLIAVQVVLLILKFTGYSILGIDVSDWSWFKVLLPIIAYAGLKYLFGLSESLSNIFNWLLGAALFVGFLYLIYYILTL